MRQKIAEGDMLLILFSLCFIGSLSGSDLLLDCAVAKMARGRKIEVKDSDRCMKEFPEVLRGGPYAIPVPPLLNYPEIVSLAQSMLPYDELPDYARSHIAFAEISDPLDYQWRWFCIENLQGKMSLHATHQAYQESLGRKEGAFFIYLDRIKSYIRKLGNDAVLERARAVSVLKEYIGDASALKRILISHIDSFACSLAFDRAYYMPAHDGECPSNRIYSESEQRWRDIVDAYRPLAFIPWEGGVKEVAAFNQLCTKQPYAIYAINDSTSSVLNNQQGMVSACACKGNGKWYCHTLGVAYLQGIPVPYAVIDNAWYAKIYSPLNKEARPHGLFAQALAVIEKHKQEAVGHRLVGKRFKSEEAFFQGVHKIFLGVSRLGSRPR